MHEQSQTPLDPFLKNTHEQVESSTLRNRKRFFVLKAMAAKGSE